MRIWWGRQIRKKKDSQKKNWKNPCSRINMLKGVLLCKNTIRIKYLHINYDRIRKLLCLVYWSVMLFDLVKTSCTSISIHKYDCEWKLFDAKFSTVFSNEYRITISHTTELWRPYTVPLAPLNIRPSFSIFARIDFFFV